MRIAFMGTPPFAARALKALIAAGHVIAAVYSQPPRPAGRGHKLVKSAVHTLAEAHGIEVRTPQRLKSPEEHAAFSALSLDLAVVAAYGLILPKAILDAPKLGCLNIHASLLPRWRGAAPIQRAIMAGDAETGVTIMRMDVGLDTGPMLLKANVPIGRWTTSASLTEELSDLGAKLVVEAVTKLEKGELPDIPQPEEGMTYAAKLDRADGVIDWRHPAGEIDRRVRALNPWPGTSFEIGGERIKLLEATPTTARGTPGTIVGTSEDGSPVAACGEGALKLTLLQRPGRAPQDGASFLRGFALPLGTVLGGNGDTLETDHRV
jgi:methionyl-tRNA formyltransferase